MDCVRSCRCIGDGDSGSCGGCCSCVTVVVVEEDTIVLVVDGFVAAEGVGSGVVGTSTAQTSA